MEGASEVKKRKKHSGEKHESTERAAQELVTADSALVEATDKLKKKKRKHREAQEEALELPGDGQPSQSTSAPVEEPASVDKPLKKKKRKHKEAHREPAEEPVQAGELPQIVSVPVEASATREKPLQKKKRTHNEAQAQESAERAAIILPVLPAEGTSALVEELPGQDKPSKKQKRKHQALAEEATFAEPKVVEVPVQAEELPAPAKKKRKHTAPAEEGASIELPAIETPIASTSTSPPTKPATPVYSGSDFLKNLQAIAAKPRPPPSDAQRKLDLAEIFKVTPRPSKPASASAKSTKSKKEPQAKASKVPASREALLSDWSISVKEAAKKAEALGFTLRQGAFSKTEDEKIRKCVDAVCRRQDITESQFVEYLVGTKGGGDHRDSKGKTMAEFRSLLLAEIPDRLLKTVQLHARIMYDSSRRQARFTAEESHRATQLHEQYGNEWVKIGEMLGRSGDDVKHHFRKIVENKSRNTGVWYAEEVQKLKDAYDDLVEPGKTIPWLKLSEAVATRTPHQCQRYIENHPIGRNNEAEGWSKVQVVALLKALKRSRPKNESEIQWPAYLSEAPLTGFSAHLLQQKWKRLSTKYIKKHGEPTKFKKLLKGMLVEAKNMPDKPARAAKKAASDASGAFKSAEFVESEDEDEEELPEA